LAQLASGSLVLKSGGQPRADQVQLGLLCGPPRYADAVGVGAGSASFLACDVGIIGAG
jgi:hypothetical protein